MKQRFTVIVLLLCLVAGVFTQDEGPILTEEDLNDPEFLKVLNNYFGCKVWEEGVCVECSENFYFNDNGICC